MKVFTNFSFHMYTDILFGKDTEKKVAEMIKKHGGTKVMMVYGGGSVKKMGLYDTIVKSLNEAGIPFVELGGVQPNPRRTLVEKGLKIAQDEGVDFMLGVGGGSSIDTAKAIALGLANGGEYWKFYQGTAPAKMALVGTIHTISAAGSETSGSSVLLDDIDTHRKYGFMYTVCRPVFAIMNPELTYSVSPFQTGAGTADILAHTVSRSFSHNDLNSIGRFTASKGAEHALETQLSGTYDTAHGAGLSVVMPSWLQYLVNHGEPMHVARVARFAVSVFGVDPDMNDIKGVANEGLNRFRAWLKSIGMPITLKELGVPKEDLDEVIRKCNCGPDGVIKSFMDLDKTAVAEIFTSVVE